MKYMFWAMGGLIFAFLLAGCVPPEVLYDATPVSKDTVWYSGREFVTKSADSITVSVAFENELQGVMTFYVVVGNMGDVPVLVAPERIYYEGKYHRLSESYSEGGLVYMEPTDGIDTTYAIDPEKELRGIDRQAAQANATYATNSGINAAAGLLQIVGNVATIGQKKSPEQRRQEDEATRDLKQSQEDNDINYSQETASLAGQRAYWENAALRKTTLFTGNAIAGKLRIPVTAGMSEFRLLIPMGTTEFSFEFEQHVLSPQ